jgi:ribosomal protein S18 acetylase RimI-like enzyme
MKVKYTFRVFSPEDYAAVSVLWHESDGVEVAEGDDRDSIGAYLDRNRGLSRVIEAEGQIIGAALCGHDGRRGLIYHLAISRQHRGQGLGRRLVEECAAGLRVAGIKRILILVAADNDQGRTFWESLGFETITGARPMGADL